MVATIAAAVILSVLTTTLVVGSRVDAQLAAQAETISALEEVTVTTMAVTAQPDAEHVALAGVTDPAADGNLVFSPSTTELAVVATGLAPPPAGYEYRCWVSVDGLAPAGRQDVLRGGHRLLGRPGAGHLGRLDAARPSACPWSASQAPPSRPTRSSSAGSDPASSVAG